MGVKVPDKKKMYHRDEDSRRQQKPDADSGRQRMRVDSGGQQMEGGCVNARWRTSCRDIIPLPPPRLSLPWEAPLESNQVMKGSRGKSNKTQMCSKASCPETLALCIARSTLPRDDPVA